jgi:hypothetical protein
MRDLDVVIEAHLAGSRERSRRDDTPGPDSPML